MKEILKTTIAMIREIYWKSSMKTKRNFSDFFSDRLTAACTEPTLFAAMNKLAESVDCRYGEIDTSTVAEFIKDCSAADTPAVFAWIRQYPNIAAACCTFKREDLDEVLETIQINPVGAAGVALKAAVPEIKIEIKCLSPLAHGADTKAGNNTLFRRMSVISTTNNILSLPFYSGNALRGQLRDLMADDFLRQLGIAPRRDDPPVALWFFHTMYAGGALEEGNPALKGIGKLLGQNGAARAEGFYQFRNILPFLSVLGGAMGNRILSGRCQVNDLRPRCIEWNNGTMPVENLFTWSFLTRREDHEGHDDDDNSSMIANTEVLKAGTILDGGIDLDKNATELERSAIGHALALFKNRGRLGAETRRGFGSVEVSFERSDEPELYVDYLKGHKAEIVEFLNEINATKGVKP